MGFFFGDPKKRPLGNYTLPGKWLMEISGGWDFCNHQARKRLLIPMPNRQGALLLPTISKNIHFHLYASKSYENSRRKTCHAADSFCILVEKLMLTSCL
jgi:hypothetical protein